MLHTTPRKGPKRLLALLAAAAVLSCGTAAAWLSREPLITAAPEDPAAQTTPTSDTSAQKDASENDPLGDLLAHTARTMRSPRSLKRIPRPTSLPPNPRKQLPHSRNLPRSLHSSPPQRQGNPRKTPRNCA